MRYDQHENLPLVRHYKNINAIIIILKRYLYSINCRKNASKHKIQEKLLHKMFKISFKTQKYATHKIMLQVLSRVDRQNRSYNY